MGGATSGPPMPGSSHAPPVGLPGPTASAPTGADGHPLHSANGLSRDREFPPFDHPSKRARVDEKPPYEQNGAQQHGPPHAGSSRGVSRDFAMRCSCTSDSRIGPHMAPLDTRPPHLSLARTTATPDRRTSPGPGTPGSANPIDMDPSRVPATLKNEGSDWAAIFNPKVKRELNVELVHSLTHDRCALTPPRSERFVFLTQSTASCAACASRRTASCWRRAAIATSIFTTRQRAPRSSAFARSTLVCV